jgi:RNA polymerase sigma factor (sigma-70 family)
MSADDSKDCMALDGAHRSFANLLKRARAGCPEAWRILVARYNRRMSPVIRCWVGRRVALWRRLDPADIMQDVWVSVLRALTAGTAFPDEPTFNAYLKVVTRHCTRMQLRLHTRKQRSMEREEASPAGCDLRSKEPGPAESAAAADLLDKWLNGSGSLDERAILVWAMKGHDARELADCMKMNLRTVRRIVQRARTRWTTLSGGGR